MLNSLEQKGSVHHLHTHPFSDYLLVIAIMTSSYNHQLLDRQALIGGRLETPITAGLENLQHKKNFSVSHLLDLEESAEMVGVQAEEDTGESGRSLLESPGLTSGSDTPQQESKFPPR